jgi:pimeloyl-ACP methyl ester carboxylesterase
VASGASLAVQYLGAGPPLILLNGYGATKDDWDPRFRDGLAAGSRVICPDNRGVGASPEAPPSLSVAAMADDVLALMDARGIVTAALAGWSMGGFIAQEIAALHPERVERLVLLATDPGGPGSVRASPEAEARLRDHSGTPRERAMRLLRLLFPPAVAARMDAQFGELVAAARAALSIDALRAQEAAVDRWHDDEAAGRLAAITAPALIAHGTEDVLIPFANGELLAAGIPDSRLVAFEDCGHAFMAQEPARAAELIGDFLAHSG